MSEQVILTNMCMIEDKDGRILVQNRLNPNWPGITFPGGHVEKLECFHDAVVREVWEETGLKIAHPKLCGIKQFQTEKDERYIVLFYKTQEYQGVLKASEEGEVFWIKKEDLDKYPLASDFDMMIKVFLEEELSEFYYDIEDDWNIKLF